MKAATSYFLMNWIKKTIFLSLVMLVCASVAQGQLTISPSIIEFTIGEPVTLQLSRDSGGTPPYKWEYTPSPFVSIDGVFFKMGGAIFIL